MSSEVFFAVLALLGIVAEVGLFSILLLRRQYTSFPVFTAYIGFNLLSDVGLASLLAAYPPHVAQVLELSTLPLQYVLELGVLFEIAWNVLRPVQASLPRGTIRAFAGLIALSILLGTLLAWHVRDTGNRLNEIKSTLTLTVGLLRMLIFAATAGFAQLLGIGWKNKVLRLATALSFYSAVSLIISLAEQHAAGSIWMERYRGIAYLFELGFLVWVFTTKDVRRREFSPQMEQFLVTLAGRAKLARTALVRMQVK